MPVGKRGWTWLLAASAILLARWAVAGNEGREDLRKAIQAQVNAKTQSDLSEVIRLCEAALSKGLEEQDAPFAKKLLASALSRRGIEYCKSILDAIPPDPQWPQWRRVALEDLEKAIKLDPDQVEAHYRIAELHLLLPEGDGKRAAAALDEAIRRGKGDPPLEARALRLRARLHRDPADKLADLTEALRVVPGDPASLRDRGAAYAALGRLPEALVDLNAALAVEPKHAPTLEAKAIVLGKMKQFEQAEAVLEQARRLDPKSIVPLLHRAELHAMKGDLAAAEKILDEAHIQEPTNMEVLLKRAGVCYERGDLAKAQSDIDRVLQRLPGFKPAARFRAVLLAEQGHRDEAIAELEDLAKQDPDDLDLLLQWALHCLAADRYHRALEIYTQVIQKDATNWRALRGRGNVLLNLGKHAEAIADYENAYRIHPEDPELLNNLSWVLCTSPIDNLRNGKRALELAKEACRLTDHQQAHILSTLAAAYAELGDFKTAIEWSEKAVAMGRADQKAELQKELESYRAGKPFREQKSPEKSPPPKPKKTVSPGTPEKPKPTPGKPPSG